MEVYEKLNENNNHIGIINEVNGYTVNLIINKDEAPEPIYPLKTPMPVYLKDQKDNFYLMYEQNLLAPASDLPSLNILSESGMIILDPAKHFILKSALTSFQGSAVLISESGIIEPLSDVYILEKAEIVENWNQLGFRHLKLVAELLGSERFKIFMRVFSELLKEQVLSNDSIRSDLLINLVEIGDKKGINESSDYLHIIEKFMNEDAAVIVLDNKMEDIKALIKNKELKYGDLVSFTKENRITLAVIKDLGAIAKLDPLFAIENDIPTHFVKPLEMGMEGFMEGVAEIIDNLNSRLDESFIKIPIATIPSTNQEYYLMFKGNELIHFAIIAVSGRGKGNVLKEMIFEYQKALITYFRLNKNLGGWSRLGMILFDDAGEYVKCLKPRDWGMDLGMLVLRFLQENDEMPPQIHLVDVARRRIESNTLIEEDYRFIDIQNLKIPLEYIPLEELLRTLERTRGYGLVLRYLRHYYTEVSVAARPPEFDGYRFCLEFINWFIGSPFPFTNGRDQFNYAEASYNTAQREVVAFLLNNQNYLGLQYDYQNETFSYIPDANNDPITQTITDDVGSTVRTTLMNDYNLLNLAMHCADQGETLIIDESPLEPSVKLLIQRILLAHIVMTRENRTFHVDITPCLFIIEEATALMGGKEAKQLDLFAKMQVRARKFGVGIGLVLQDINRLDPSLLTQLGWMIALGLPVNSMRSILFKNVPAELGSFDDYLKYADIGMAIGFQQLIGNNLPLPIKIKHYEKMVKDTLWSKDYWANDEFDEETQGSFREIARTLGVPEEVLDELLHKEEVDNNR